MKTPIDVQMAEYERVFQFFRSNSDWRVLISDIYETLEASEALLADQSLSDRDFVAAVEAIDPEADTISILVLKRSGGRSTNHRRIPNCKDMNYEPH